LKPNRWFYAGLFSCLVIAVLGYFWATSLMTSVFHYRSPLHSTPPSEGNPAGASLTHKVVIVLIDGLRYDTSIDRQIMPFLNSLRNEGASAIVHSQPPSFSEPGYTTILTGAWPDINDGPAVNLDYQDIPAFTQDDIFSAAHQVGLHTAISGYYWFEKLVPQNVVDASFYTSGEDADADQQVVQAALPWLRANFQLILIHLDQVDYAGHHEGGPLNPNWDAAANRTDSYLHKIVDALDLGVDTVIVTSDHGQIDRGGHGGPEPITLLEPLVMVGAGIQNSLSAPDIYQVDIAPTIAILLGTRLPASSEGSPQTAMLRLPSDRASAIKAMEAIQKTLLLQAYSSAISTLPGRDYRPTDLSSFMVAMDSARSVRLFRERILRSLVALAFLAIIIFLFFATKKKIDVWMALGAIIYVVVYNFRYAILDGRTYSLSSVEGQTWLIIYNAVNSSIAIALGWLVSMICSHSFQNNPLKAAQASLRYAFFILALLALPVLINFVANGFLVTWTLPEFYSSYIALLSLIQMIFVALLGLILTGLSSLVAYYGSRLKLSLRNAWR